MITMSSLHGKLYFPNTYGQGIDFAVNCYCFDSHSTTCIHNPAGNFSPVSD